MNRWNKMAGISCWVRASRRASSTVASNLQETPLKDLHLEHAGKMVPFAGWNLPVLYSGSGVLNETVHTRTKASIFDVSHMQQLKITGPSSARIKFIETICPSNIGNLQPNQGQYTVFTNKDGGIIDDAIITNLDSHHHIVCNAACAEKDINHLLAELASFNKQNGSSVNMEIVSDQALIALQGPKAAAVLSEHVEGDNFKDLFFFYTKHISLGGTTCMVSRSGYTGEDGFEISIPKNDAMEIVSNILKNADCKLAGLGARDALRLEAGLCLYGHDLDESISPIEAGLSWTIGKRRRKEGGFLGDERILGQLQNLIPLSKTRIGLKVNGAPAREGCRIVNESGEEIGQITSGGFSPTLKCPIAMGYISANAKHEPNTEIGVEVRKNIQRAAITSMPFVPTKYVKKPSAGKPSSK